MSYKMLRFVRIAAANYRRFGNFKSQVDFKPKFPRFDTSNGKSECLLHS